MTAHTRTIPACMSREDYALWDSDELAHTDSPCRDCLRDYHEAMLAEGRCDGTPRQARTLDDGSYLARRRAQYRASAQRRRARLVDSRVAASV